MIFLAYDDHSLIWDVLPKIAVFRLVFMKISAPPFQLFNSHIWFSVHLGVVKFVLVDRLFSMVVFELAVQLSLFHFKL